MNHTNEESKVHPREDYLGKGICHYSVASPITNQPFSCPLQLLSNPQSCLFQTFIFSASGQRSMNQTWSLSLLGPVATISSKWRISEIYSRPLMTWLVCCCTPPSSRGISVKNAISYTDEQEVVGLCGLHKEYETDGKDSTRQMYPWMASIIVQVNGSAVIVELQRVRNDMTRATLNTANLCFFFLPCKCEAGGQHEDVPRLPGVCPVCADGRSLLHIWRSPRKR